MASKKNITFAMTKDEKIAHRKKLCHIRQQRWRDKRKNALSLVPPENLPRCTDHYLEKMVQSDLENKAKAQKRAKKNYNTISMNPRLLAERRHKDSWRKRVHRAYHGVFYRWKKKESDETRILLGAKTLREELESKLDRKTTEFKKFKSWRVAFFYTNFYDKMVDKFDLE